MMKIESLVEQLISDLNDDESGREFSTWTEDQIRAWIDEAYSLMYDKRPDLFFQEKVIQVTPCQTRQDIECCDAVRRVAGQTNSDGVVIRPLKESNLELSFDWTGKTCINRKSNFKLESYSIDTVSGSLYLFPPVPINEDVYVLVECTQRPDGTEDDLILESIPAVKQWVLWRAKSMDMEISNNASNAAKTHYQAFFDLLGLSTNIKALVNEKGA